MLDYVIKSAKVFAVSAYAYVIVDPLRRLYLHGPRLHGYGFWKGAAPHDICAALTNYESAFWKNNEKECMQVIERDFNSLVVLVETIMYFSALILTIKLLYILVVQLYPANTQTR